MKHKAIMAIALLALVSLMITPVCAWDVYFTDTYTEGVIDELDFYMGFWQNSSVTMVEAINVKAIGHAGNILTGSHSGVIQCAHEGGPIGNYTATWQDLSIGWGETFDIQIVFDDIDIESCDPGDGFAIVYLLGLHTYIEDAGNSPGSYGEEGALADEVPFGSFGGHAHHGEFMYTSNFQSVITLYSGDPPPPVASFTCVPTSQYPNTDVVCTDTSTGTWIDEWLWTIDAEAYDLHGWKTNTSQDFTWQSAYPGIFSVNLRATNSGGSDWYNRSNYVSISVNATPNDCSLPVATGYIRSMAQCVDTQTSGAIHGCNLQLNDIEGVAWSNVTERFDGTWCIDTLPLHHINAYGQATGYSSASRFNLPVSSSVMYELFMIPGYVTNASEGHVWLYVLANDYDTGAALSSATVLVSGSGEASQTRTTGLSGQVIFEWVNASTIYVTVDKSGYSSVSKVATTSDYGPDTVRVELHRVIVTPTATSTPGPGGVTAAPTLDTRSTTEKDTAMMNQVRDAGPILISLAILATIMGLVKLMAKK